MTTTTTTTTTMYCAGNLTSHRSSITAVATPLPHYVANADKNDSFWPKKYKLITGSRDNSLIIWGDEEESSKKNRRSNNNNNDAEGCVDSENENDDDDHQQQQQQQDKSHFSKSQKRKLAKKKKKMASTNSATTACSSTISGCSNSTAEAPLASPLRRLEGHTGFISDLCLSRDGRMVLSSSWDRSLRLWEVETGNLICKCTAGGSGHTKDILSCSLIEFEVALQQHDDDVKKKGKEEVPSSPAANAAADTATSATTSTKKQQSVNSYVLALSSGRDNTIRLWNLPIYENCSYGKYRYNTTGQCIRIFTGHQDWVSSVKWVCPGRLLKEDWTFENGSGVQLMGVSEYLSFASSGWDGQLVHWKVRFQDIWSTLVVLMSTPPSAKSTFDPPVLTLAQGINALSSSSSSVRHSMPATTTTSAIASGAQNGKSTISAEILAKQVTKSHDGCITCLTVSPDGSLIATCGKDGHFKLWDFSHQPNDHSAMNLDFILDIPNLDQKTHDRLTEPIFHLAYSPNKYWMAVISETSVRVYDLESKQVLATCSSPQTLQFVKTPPSPTCCSFTRDSDTLYVGYSDNIVRVFCIFDAAVKNEATW